MLHQKILTGVTTGTGTAKEFRGQPRELKFYITATGTVAAGAVQIEEAPSPTYAGTWSPIGSPVTVASDTTKTVAVTGAFGSVRARVSTDVTGGATVSVDLFATEDVPA